MLCGYMNKQMDTLQSGMWNHYVSMLIITVDLGQAHTETCVNMKMCMCVAMAIAV